MRPFRRPLRALLPAMLLVAPALAAPGCVAPTTARGIALDDPLGLVMDVARTGHPLRVYVLPASSYVCNDTIGTISPDIQDALPGMVPDAVVDISADVSGDMATAMAVIPVGDWTVLVRGKGTDPVSGRPDRVIATGCTAVGGLGANETRAVRITLLPQHDMGMCNDGVLSPDEQCDPPSTPATQCNATCHTTPIPVNVHVTNGAQTAARAASSTGQRIAITFDSAGAANDIGIRMLDANGGMVGTAGMSIAQDETIDTLAMPLPGPQNAGRPAMASDGHFAIALANLFPAAGDDSDVLVQFFSADRAPMATFPASGTTAGIQTAPDAAYSGSGALLVVYQDSTSATGIAGELFAPGSMTAAMRGFAIGGAGTTGATHPVVAGLATGFVVAFVSGTDVHFQRFAANGTATDATAIAVLDAADAADTQDQPAIAANADGSFLIAWTEHSVANGDGMGTSIRARAFGTTGTPASAAITLPSTDASKAGDQRAPSVAAADGRYLVAWASVGSVHARVVSGMGAPLPNREQPQSTNDFVVAAAGNAPSATAMGTTPASWLVAYDDGDSVFARRYPR